jgi:MFS family permease
MLPTTVAIVSSAFSRGEAGRTLGTDGGTAAVAGPLGPTIGGVLTAVFSWRAVLLINVPLLVLALLFALRDVTKFANIPDGGGWRFLGRVEGRHNAKPPLGAPAAAASTTGP